MKFITMQDCIPLVHEAQKNQGINVPNQMGHEESAEITEQVSPILYLKRPRLSVEIPSKDSGDPSVRINMPATPGSASAKAGVSTPTSAKRFIFPSPLSSKGKPTIKNLLSRLSFKSPTSAIESEKYSTQVTEVQSEKPTASRSLSFKKLFMPAVRRTSSLPVTHATLLGDNSLKGATAVDHPDLMQKKGFQKHISRSLSVPANSKSRSIKRTDSSGAGFRVIPSTPQGMDMTSSMPNTASNNDDEIDGDGEDIPEEEAVCRICMIELKEGGDTLKLECNCKGELALAHQECAVKWFSIKGNRNCEVCKQEVQNLPVTLLRIQFVPTSRTGNVSHQTTFYPIRLWLDMPVLVIVSMLSYFCFLEQLLVFDNGSAALAISLPFSCILGLFASMTSSTMVTGRYTWVYASIQFLLVVTFAHLFYSRIHMQAIISIILATFAGFGITMSGSSVVTEFLRWRRRRLRAARHNARDFPASSVPSTTTLNVHESSENLAVSQG